MMKNPMMGRRDFLKGLGTLAAGMAVLPFLKLFREKTMERGGSTTMREARFYTSGDNLAG